jgi:hypothetical protein
VVTPWEFVLELNTWRWRFWTQYWGQLVWLDYQAAPFWYGALLVVVLAGAGLAAWRGARGQRPGTFLPLAALFGAAFVIGVLAAVYRGMPSIGLQFQGRYLLPASPGLTVVLADRWRAWRVALALFMVAFNLALLQRTVERYYEGDWSRAWRATVFATNRRPTGSYRRDSLAPYLSRRAPSASASARVAPTVNCTTSSSLSKSSRSIASTGSC